VSFVFCISRDVNARFITLARFMTHFFLLSLVAFSEVFRGRPCRRVR
jgi:hypothetical protein